jgi:hypothetical protein
MGDLGFAEPDHFGLSEERVGLGNRLGRIWG